MITIHHLDHLVLTVTNIEVTCAFYHRVLGMNVVTFGEGGNVRTALTFGAQKINLHAAGHEFEPKSKIPIPGSADLCFITETPIDAVIAHLQNEQIAITEGPVPRTGAISALLSVYIRDPDGNLIEIANKVS